MGLIHSDTQDIIKQDNNEDNSEERNFGLSESVTISRSQAAMQQLQESFGSFLPGMGQSPGFLPHGATDMPRPPPYSLEGFKACLLGSRHCRVHLCHKVLLVKMPAKVCNRESFYIFLGHITDLFSFLI